MATAVSLGLSLGVDALLVVAATALFPSIAGYTHFRFSDYALLTTIGILAAGLAWPVVARVTSAPRWLFFRMALVVSAVLIAPDAWLLARGEPPRAVAVLVAMHVAIALITYNLLVRAAPAETATSPPAPAPVPAAPASAWSAHATWITMAALVGLEGALGVAALVVVPYGRPDVWLPTGGRAVYVVHAVVGGVLGLIGAVLVLATRTRPTRVPFYSALVGFLGVAVGAGGGVLAVYRADRLAGMGLMFLGVVVAGFAYLTPISFAERDALRERPLGESAALGEWEGGAAGELVCDRCHALAAETKRRVAPDVNTKDWASARIAAGICPLCPDSRLRAPGGVSMCGCCRTVYRRLPGEVDDAAWVASPGRRVR